MPAPGARLKTAIEKTAIEPPDPAGAPPFFSFRTETQALRPRRLGGRNSQGGNRRLHPSETGVPSRRAFRRMGWRNRKTRPKAPPPEAISIYHVCQAPFYPLQIPERVFVCCRYTDCTYTSVFQTIFCSLTVRFQAKPRFRFFISIPPDARCGTG